MHITNTTSVLAAANAYVCIRCDQYKSVGLKVSGTFVGTLTFTGQVDDSETGGNAVSVWDASPALVSSVTADGSYIFPVSGYTVFTVTMSSYTSGSAAITLTPADSVYVPPVAGGTGPSANVTVTSSVLPTGAATGAKQDTGNTAIASLVTGQAAQATAAKQDTGNTSIATVATNTTGLNTLVGPVTPGTASTASALGATVHNTTPPTVANNQQVALQSDTAGNLMTVNVGGATAANQTTELASLASLVTNTTGLSTAANQATAQTSLSSIVTSTAASATAANQATAQTSLSAIQTSVALNATAANQATEITALNSIVTSVASLATNTPAATTEHGTATLTAVSSVEGTGICTVAKGTYNTLTMALSGTNTGAVTTFSGSYDNGVTFPDALTMTRTATSTPIVTIAGNDTVTVDFGKYTHIKATLTAITTGSVVNTWALSGNVFTKVAEAVTDLLQLVSIAYDTETAVNTIAINTPTQAAQTGFANLAVVGSLEGTGICTVARGSATTLSFKFTAGNASSPSVTFAGSLDGGYTFPDAIAGAQFGSGSVSTPVTTVTGAKNVEFSFGNYTHIRATLASITSGSFPVQWALGGNKLVKIGALGDQADASITDSTQVGSLLAFAKGSVALASNVQANAGSSASKATAVQGIAGGVAMPVSAVFWQATQPVSAASLPLPTGAAQETGGNLATLVTNTAIQPYKAVAGQTVTGPASASAVALPGGVGGNLLDSTAAGLWTDVRGLGVVTMKLTVSSAIATGQVTFEQADDASGTNFMTLTGVTFGQSNTNSLVSALSPTPSIATKYIVVFPASAGFVRMRVSTSFTGSPSVSASYYATNMGSIYQVCGQSGVWTFGGLGAHAAAISGNPSRAGLRAITANYTAVTTGQTADAISTLVGAQIVKPYSIPEADWSYAAAAGGISNTTTAVTIAAAAGAGLRNYITGIDLTATALGVGTEFAIRDGAGGTVLWRTDLTTSGLLSGFPRTFTTPLRGSANTLLEIVTLTATVTGSVYFNGGGYIAP